MKKNCNNIRVHTRTHTRECNIQRLPCAKDDSDTRCYTDHAGSGRESRDSHVGLYWAAQGSKTEQSVSSNNMTAAIVQIMWLVFLLLSHNPVIQKINLLLQYVTANYNNNNNNKSSMYFLSPLLWKIIKEKRSLHLTLDLYPQPG